ncbi:hypothetical protein HBN50_12595 [Halobacteriovorax sp. GB3]|uniref:hypothetical protein n=1 Tax=Halobacteriovorax sp. GB3 TaxID=2719615 RepID=UPI00235F0E78|nr:hypothetical protein [Halobacteriovorax sp. GB3]MDD0853943.1 hypothetical protein [Halobacteriovorax sp. GB3]
MFINRTTIPNISGVFTYEYMKSISAFPEIRITSGAHSKADAIMLGILDSSNFAKSTIKRQSNVFIDGALAKSIGARQSFYLPSSVLYTLSLRIIIIRRPTKEEMELVSGDLGKYISQNSKIVFNEVFPITASVSKIIESSESVDEGGVVNFTRNQRVFNESIEDLAKSSANTFREVVLNAF